MSNAVQDTNLELLIGLKQHLDHAAKLRAILDRLLNLATAERQEANKKAGGHERLKP